MKFRSTLLRAAGVVAAAALLASCGGGTSNGLVAFIPARILVFGDQSSVITAEPVASEGRKYTINAINTDGTVNCTSNPLWIQVLASSYAMGFPECPNKSETAAPPSRILAKAGATAGGTREIDLTQQVTRQMDLAAADGGGIGSNDMVTVLAGVNDVVAAYERFEAGASDADVTAQAEQAGTTIAEQVNRIANAGGKVIVSTVPDVSQTPYGRSKGVDGMARLSYLTSRVNARLLVQMENNGRKIGLIELNPYLISVTANPTGYGYKNVKDRACVPLDVLNCTTSTLKTNDDGSTATSYTWLWASELQLSPGGHLQLGSLASTRAHNQPF